MSTTTTRLGLYKTASDGSELVNVVNDLLNNLDSIDLNIGYRDCTSSTRPSTVWKGLPIRESDTGRLYVSNGTAPASGSWKQIPAEGASFLAAFTYASTLTVAGATNLNSTLAVTGAATLGSTLAVTGATVINSTLRAAGAASLNSTLTVTGAATLGSTLGVTGITTLSSNLSVAGSASVSGNATVSGNLTVSGIGQWLTVHKTSNQNVTASTTLVSDSHLLLPVVANAVYEMEAFIAYDGAFGAGELKVDWSVPSAATLYWALNGPTTGGGALYDSNVRSNGTAAAAGTYGTGGTQTSLNSRGRLTVGANAGNLQFRFAQSASNATATTVYAGSWIRLLRIS